MILLAVPKQQTVLVGCLNPNLDSYEMKLPLGFRFRQRISIKTEKLQAWCYPTCKKQHAQKNTSLRFIFRSWKLNLAYNSNTRSILMRWRRRKEESFPKSVKF